MPKSPSSRFLKIGLLLLGCCLLLVAAVYWKNSPKQSTVAAPQGATAAIPASAQVAPSSALHAKGTPSVDSTVSADLSSLTYANHWKQETKPAFAPFNHWVAQYLNAPVASRSTLEAEGERLAEARRKAMEELIEKDPKEAI